MNNGLDEEKIISLDSRVNLLPPKDAHYWMMEKLKEYQLKPYEFKKGKIHLRIGYTATDNSYSILMFCDDIDDYYWLNREFYGYYEFGKFIEDTRDVSEISVQNKNFNSILNLLVNNPEDTDLISSEDVVKEILDPISKKYEMDHAC